MEPTNGARLAELFARERADHAVTASPELGAALTLVLASARQARPALRLDAERFVRYLAVRWPDGEPVDGWLAALPAPDLFLACACADGGREALAMFEAELMSRVPGFLLRTRAPQAVVEEVCQILREKLFVAPPGGVPKIASYTGRGTLESWLRVLAVRTAVDLRRVRVETPAERDDDRESHESHPDPEIDFLKTRYRDAFNDALRSSLATLSGEHRNLLRLHFVDGLTLDQLATFFHIHRATVSRRVAAAREAIRDQVRAVLQERLGLPPHEFESLFRILRSQLDVSLHGCLRGEL
jgi:RNA polymerase sigma-70 factor (ECF subfamily)